MGKQGDLRGELEIGESTQADFFLRSSPHLFLVYFVLFFPVSFFLLSQQLYIRVFSPMMDI